MRNRAKGLPAAGLLLALTLLLAACATDDDPATRVVEVTRLVTVTPANAEVTRLVVITATPTPTDRRAFRAPDATSYRVAAEDEPRTLDPAVAGDAGSLDLLNNVVEPLLYPDPSEGGSFLPLLATGWEIADDGRTYTFALRPNVTFSNGNALTPSDVAYSMRRAMLLSPAGGPQGLLLEPLLGYTSGDVTEDIESGLYAGDREALLANAPDGALQEVCERVQAAVVADDEAGTVTFNLAQSWAPFLAALSRPTAAAVDRDWTVERGAWDGNCETWQQWYAPAEGETALATMVLGTGPYVLDRWTPGKEYVLVANEDYWRNPGNEMWEGGPSGRPGIESVTVHYQPQPEQRWEMLRSGQVDTAALPAASRLATGQWVGSRCDWRGPVCTETNNADAPLRAYAELPRPVQGALFFNFNIEAEENAFIGSGRLDGNGIPADFFDDINVRRAFAYCFDAERFVREALAGNGVAHGSLIPAFLRGEGGAPAGRSDLEQCAGELMVARGGGVAANGFRLQVPFAAGDLMQQVAATILQENLQSVNEAYNLEIVGLSSARYRQALVERRLPLAAFTWTPEVPDPHAWSAPAYSGEPAAYQQLPTALEEQFGAAIAAGAAATNRDGRAQVYAILDQLAEETAPYIPLPQPAGQLYQQRWVEKWFYHPTVPHPYYYAYSLQGDE